MTGKFVQPDMTTQDVATYKTGIDTAIAVLAKQGAGFAPRALDTPVMRINVDPGVTFNRGSGGFNTQALQQTALIVAPGSNSKIVRVYITEAGVIGTVEGATAVSPVAPTYPAGCFPIAQFTVAAATTTITNAMITDERAFGTNYGTPKNTFLITASVANWIAPPNSKCFRITAAAAGAGGGPGASSASDTNKYGGGAGGGGASVIQRLFNAENLNIVIGAHGVGGHSATAAGVTTGQTAATTGGVTSVTGNVTGVTFSCAGGVLGGAATIAANGTGGVGGAVGTGVAGTAGTNGVTNTKGGDGGAVGTSGSLSIGGLGAVLASTRTGSPGVRGSGGGGAVGFGVSDKGGDGGDGFVLIEVF